jgi:hypothetical protein
VDVEGDEPPQLPESPTPSAIEAPKPEPEWRRRLRSRLRRLAYRFFPTWYGRYTLRQEPEYIAERDAKADASAVLPDGEEVGIRCVWVMEVYLASQVDHLLDGVRELGLDKGDPARIDPIDSVLTARARGKGGGGWVALNPLVARGARRSHFFRATPTDLPTGVKSVFMTAITPWPSATILAAQFRFDDATARGIEQPFSVHYPTRSEPKGRFIVTDRAIRSVAKPYSSTAPCFAGAVRGGYKSACLVHLLLSVRPRHPPSNC